MLLCSAGAQATGVDISVSNTTFQGSLLLNPLAFRQGGGSEVGIGGFYGEEAGDKLAHVTLIARGYRQSPTSQYSLGAGIKGIYGDVNVSADLNNGVESGESVGAVAMGFQAGMLISSSRHNPIEGVAEFFIAPSVTSFSDAEQYLELSARVQIEIIPQVQTYLGYRRIRFDTRDFNNVQVDRSWHFGIRYSY